MSRQPRETVIYIHLSLIGHRRSTEVRIRPSPFNGSANQSAISDIGLFQSPVITNWMAISGKIGAGRSVSPIVDSSCPTFHMWRRGDAEVVHTGRASISAFQCAENLH